MNIKSFRESKKLTQEELASLIGIKRSTVAMWEAGQSKPRADMLIKLSQILDCTMEELLGINKNPPTEGQA